MILCNFTIILNEKKDFNFLNIKSYFDDLYIKEYLSINNNILILSLICRRETTSKYMEFEKITNLLMEHLPSDCICTYKKINFLSDEEELKIYFKGRVIENNNMFFYEE